MGGKTLYFGEIGDSSNTLISYFERHGARTCGQDENPAEWILEVTGTAPRSESTQDWSSVWNDSEERRAVKAELARLKETLSQQPVSANDPEELRTFAASFGTQLWVVLIRIFQQYWRTPSYLYSKVALCLFSVSPDPIFNATWKVSNSSLAGDIHRIFLLENTQFPPRTPEPTFRRLHAPHHILQLLPTNHAPLRNPARALRGPRTSVKDLFLGRVHPVEHPCRDPLERAHGCARFLRLVLPHRIARERRGGRPGD